MKDRIQSFLLYPTSLYNVVKTKFIALKRSQQVIVVGVILLIAGLGISSLGSSTAVEEITKSPREVKVALVSELSSSNSNIPLLGTVTSISEATIRTESSGKLTRVYKRLGDYVTAGEVIAEFENSAERASVLQAEGVYDAAKASRDIAKINSGTTDSSLADTKTTVVNTISSSYITMDDAVRVKTDGVFTNPRNADVKLAMTIPDANLQYSLESQRRAIEKILISRDATNRTLTTEADLFQELNSALTEVRTIKAYLDDLASAHAKAIPDTVYSQTTLDTYRVSLGVARTAVGAMITTLIASKTALQASISAQEISGKTLSNGQSSTATADALVKQAEGAYNAALSRLQKTIIRSPISGTLNSLTIETGDYVTQFSEIAVVSNNGALEVLAYVTENDIPRLPVGSPVLINGTIKGVITRIATALDPLTKKIEVRIGITDKASKLINGQSVRVNVTSTASKSKTSTGPITVPLSAIKITPNGSYIFTVNEEDNTLSSIEVTTGTLLGSDIQVLSGITADISIVVDARGLKEGTVVTVKSD